MEEMITVPKKDYDELKRKAEAYDKIHAKLQRGASAGGKNAWAKLTPEERSARAKKAVQARIAKYGQKSRD